MIHRVGIGISTTAQRPEVFNKTLKEWQRYLPEGAEIVVVHDFTNIAEAKNECLRQLEELGVTDYFLSDDDTHAVASDWWKPFVESPEPHLLYNFPLKSKGKNDMRILYQDDKIISYSHTRGCMIYVTQEVLDTVGGFDTRYVNGFEHPDYTNRIHNAGLTTHRSMTPVGADKLIYCLDQDNKIESSIKKDPVQNMKNYRLYRENRLSKDFKEFR